MRAFITHIMSILTGIAVYFAVLPTCRDANAIWFAYVGACISFILCEGLMWSTILRVTHTEDNKERLG